jgi:peptide/nickel transport system permease protein
MGHSLRTGEAVSKRIFSTLKISISISLVAIFLAYLFSIPLDVHSVLYPNSKRSKALVLLQFILPALPSFFVAGLLLFLFANPSILSIFPASGIAPINAKSFLDSLPYLVLPIIAFSYTHITFVSKTVQTKIREALQMPFASFLRDNGVSEKRIAYRYALPLSYIPLLQLLAHAIPASIAGAVIIENIFSIPGMGSLLFESIATHDYPITVGIFTLIAISTLLAYVISDILAMILDRRLMR